MISDLPKRSAWTAGKTKKDDSIEPSFFVLFLDLLADDSVSVEASVYSNCREAENDYCYECIADIGESLLPVLVAETHALECAPETVAEVKTESYEPYDVNNNPDPAAECGVEEVVRVCCMVALELCELHVSPEVVEVECDDTENDNSEYEHVLCCP